MGEIVEVNRGSDRQIVVDVKTPAGGIIALSSAALLDVHPVLDGRLELVLSGGAGVVTVNLEGTPALPVGLYTFRVTAVTVAGADVSSAEIVVRVR